VLAFVVAGLVGCGGGGGGVDKSSGAYQGAFDSCSAVPLKQLAAESGVEMTPEAVADYIGKSIAGPGGPRADYEAGRQGCLDGLASP